ncbi:TPA: DUF3173 family protein [Streptococcus agalactiae]|nr:DUF3173 family protein [Streptococcus agalactiae]HEN6136512.1 DUF3173 family protein [Streptococcus agalactiae]HEN6138267.1 DUF3173 family protein [Streptococcus agalactiae]HEN6430498.1 DUF3173 family protein [Streptococcus agalactiae]HEN6529236.1 DUF3173 family protein [Streptococcus agalactiae]
MNIGVFLAYNGKGVIMITVTKKAKELMITKGHTYYQSRKLDRVPREAVEEILGIRFSNENRSE